MREYKINMDRTDPTPEEIAKNKDFSKVLDKYAAISTPIYAKPWFLSTATLVLAASLLIIINLINIGEKPPVKDLEQNYVYQSADLEQITETPYVNPPLENVDVAYQNYEVDAGSKSKLDYKTGTKIKVPKNAFVDANGEAIQGKVDIKYREFHDVPDFFVSGIPMDYDSAGVKYHFESAGMIEMLAFQNGEPVFMNPDKKVKIEMASNYEGTHYNLYELDTDNRKWEHRGKDVVTPVEGSDPPPAAQVAEQSWEDADEIVVEEIEESPYATQTRTVQKLTRKVDIAKKAVEKVKKTKPVEPVVVSKQRYHFDITIVEAGEFPEIEEYEGTLFEIGDENTGFSSKMYDIQWDDVLLEEKDPSVSYNLTLSKGKTKYTWVVYPVFEEKDMEKAKQVFQEKFSKYKEKLSSRIIAEEKAEEELNAKLAEYKKMRDTQSAEWKAQLKNYEQAYLLQTARSNTARAATRAFSITRFGTWNCDSPIRRPIGKSVAATFTDEDGNILSFNNVYLVQRDQNAMFTYNRGMFNKIKFNPNEENVIWGVTADNRLAIFHSDRFTEIPNRGGKFTFKMKVLKNEMGSVAEVRRPLAYRI
ncbi:MAG: hypothetical protein JKX73_07350 [Flavobacteriales bacterium]|nr:hypothetical protein [Flavobacteriales bacterium]